MLLQNTIPYFAKRIIDKFQLLPHPEGGFYKETYCSTETIATNALPARFSEERYISTAIYFLVLNAHFSAFHRIKSDECWHFYEGDTLQIHLLSPINGYQLIKLGRNIESGELYQAVVPAGTWFASETLGDFSFVGCTVAPAFHFDDFELANAPNLIQEFPLHTSLINRLCK